MLWEARVLGGVRHEPAGHKEEIEMQSWLGPVFGEFFGTLVLIVFGDGDVAATELKGSKGEGAGWVQFPRSGGTARRASRPSRTEVYLYQPECNLEKLPESDQEVLKCHHYKLCTSAPLEQKHTGNASSNDEQMHFCQGREKCDYYCLSNP